MFLGLFAWYRGLAIGPMTQVSQVQLVQPVLSILWAALILRERLTWPTALGGLVVVACALLAVRARLDTARSSPCTTRSCSRRRATVARRGTRISVSKILDSASTAPYVRGRQTSLTWTAERMEGQMAHEEKRAWIMAVVAVVAYGIYAARVGPQLASTSAGSTPYASALLASVMGAIAATIVLEILAAILGRDADPQKDRRDREIHRAGQYIGQSFVILGAVTALLMALARWDSFWIANVIYLGFTLSAVAASIAKIVAYRRGFQSW
jgi:hypothetical protein